MITYEAMAKKTIIETMKRHKSLPIIKTMTKEDFFAGVSIPRNKELMRIFRDLELVESLGSGMGYIMQKYGRENFVFLDNFIRMTVPYITKDREGQPVATAHVKAQVTPPVTQVEAQVDANPTSNPTSIPQVTPPEALVATKEAQVKAQVARHILVLLAHEPLGSSEIVKGLGHKSLSGVVKAHLKKLLLGDFIELTQPDSPRSPTQKYHLTSKGLAALALAEAEK